MPRCTRARPHGKHDRPGDAKDDVNRVFERPVARRVAASRRVDRGDRHFHDGHPTPQRREDDLRLEAEALVVGAKRERALDGITAQSTLRVPKSAKGEQGDEEVGDVVADEVRARRPGPRELPSSQDERSLVDVAFEQPFRFSRRMLTVGVHGDRDVATEALRRSESRSDRRPLAHVFRVPDDAGARGFGHVTGGVAGPVVDDDDGQRSELLADAAHDARHRSGRVEGGDKDSGAHRQSF